MGNKVSRKRDAPANSDETEQKPGEESEEAVEIEDLDVVVGESITEVMCLPSEECTLEFMDAAKGATLNDGEPEPVQPEILVSVSKPPTNSEPAAEAKPAPEPAPKPELTSNLESEIEAASELVLDPVEALEKQTDMLTQESLLEPVFSSPGLFNLGFPDVTPKPVNTPPSPAPIPTPVNAEVTKKCQDIAEAAGIFKPEPEKPEETPASQEKPMEATENVEELESDVNGESISGLLKNLELKGNELVTDLILSDAKIPDDTPITDISTSTELM